MGIVIRQGIKGSIVTYLGTAVGTFNVLFLYNKFLLQEQIGLIAGALVSIPILLSSITQLGLPQMAVRFFPYFNDSKKEHNGFFLFLLIAPLIGISLFIITYLSFKQMFFSIYEKNSPLLPNYFLTIIPLTICYIYMNVLEAYAKVHLRIVVPAIIREIYLRLSNAILIIAYAFEYLNFDQLIYSITLSYLLAVVFLLIYIKKLKKFYTKVDLSFIRKPIFKEMINYGFWVILAGASFTLIQHIEKIMLPAFVGGLNTTAVFDINSRIAMMISIPRNVIASITSPILVQAWKNNNKHEISNIYQKSSLNLLFIGCFLFLLIWCNLDSIYQIIPNKSAYESGKLVVLLIGISKIIDMGTGLNSEILLNSKYYKYDLFFYIILALCLIISNLYLIPRYSFNGAALASLIAIICFNSIKFCFIWWKFKIQPFTIQTFLILLSGVFIFFCTLFIPTISGENIFIYCLNILIKSTFIFVFYLTIVYKFNLLPDANILLKNWLQK